MEEYKKVDVEEAMERLHMDRSFIERLMKKFLDSDILEKTEKAFSENNVEEAKLQIHSIKGTSANVGLIGLHKLALEIEAKIKENEVLDDKLLSLMRSIWNELKNASN